MNVYKLDSIEHGAEVPRTFHSDFGKSLEFPQQKRLHLMNIKEYSEIYSLEYGWYG